MTEITMESLRQYCSDKGNSPSGSASVRDFDRVIQAALHRLSRTTSWSFKRKRARFNFDNNVTATSGLAVTNGSRVVTLASGAWPAAYYTQQWNLVISGVSTVYRLAEPPNGAEAVLDAAFEGATAASTGYTASRSRYPLPGPAKKVYSVRLPHLGVGAIQPLLRDEFDAQRNAYPGSYSQPYVYTLIGNDTIEFWPAPGSVDYVAEVAYQEELEIPPVGADDATVIDWPSHMTDLLWSALKCSLAEELGADAVQFDVGLALRGWNERIKGYQTEDVSRGGAVFDMDGGSGGRSRHPAFGGKNLKGPVT